MISYLNSLDMRNLQEQVKKAFCYQKLIWPFTVWINCSSDIKNFANSRSSISNFKSFSQSLEQFSLTVGQNNFGNKKPLFCKIINYLGSYIIPHLATLKIWLFSWHIYCGKQQKILYVWILRTRNQALQSWF
jgi:hypothetical protein